MLGMWSLRGLVLSQSPARCRPPLLWPSSHPVARLLSHFSESRSVVSVECRRYRSVSCCIHCRQPLPFLQPLWSASFSSVPPPAASAEPATRSQPSSAASNSLPLHPPSRPVLPFARPPHGSFNRRAAVSERNSRLMKYVVAVAVFFLGLTYAAVPLYRIFCQRTGFGGTTQRDLDYSNVGRGVSDREIVVTFVGDAAPDLHWSFSPVQLQVKVKVGEPVLAFFRATNNRDRPVTGVATYNVAPNKTGFYFHKIQCFCFDEQRLRAGETVDMPVFFYIDPAINADRRCGDVDHIALSYTFFALRHDDEEEEQGDEQQPSQPLQHAADTAAHNSGEAAVQRP